MSYYSSLYSSIESGGIKQWWVVMQPPADLTLEEFQSEEFQILTAGMLGVDLNKLSDETNWVWFGSTPTFFEFRFTGRGVVPQDFDGQIERMIARGWSGLSFFDTEQYSHPTY